MNLNHKWVGYRNDGPFLLLLHEALGSIGQWKDFPERLSEVLNLPVLVYERQGHGMSPDFNQERTDHYLEQYAFEELPAFLELLQLQERKCLLYGHSDGGSIALLYASKYPSNVIGVISEAAHIFVEDITLDGIDAAVAYNNKYNLNIS